MSEQKIPTTKGLMVPSALLSELTYGCYAFNRGEGMSAEALKRCFPTTADAMEVRYQAELTARLETIFAGCAR